MRVQGFQGREAFIYFTHIHIIRPHTHYPPPHTMPASRGVPLAPSRASSMHPYP